MRLDLLPCPFCGGDAMIGTNRASMDWAQTHYVICKGCAARSASPLGSENVSGNISADQLTANSMAGAIAAWNRRCQQEQSND